MPFKKRLFLPFIAGAAAAAASLFALPCQALVSDDNSLIEGAKLCTRYLPRHERQFGIPEHLLAAIASTESGRYNHALGMNLPWPWTINVEGRGYFFDTKQQAIAAVQSLQSRGVQSIDVGCMQVNLHHHPYAFANLDQAFDPAYNVGYAAQFLKRNFQDENGSWRKATADYHSRSLLFGEPYARLVYGAWSRIINKVADAKAGRPILTAAASIRPHLYSHVSLYHSPHMHSISVASETSREHGVLVIRPQSAADTEALRASQDEAFVRGANAAGDSAENSGKAQDGMPMQLAEALAPSHSGRVISAADALPESKGAQIVKIPAHSSEIRAADVESSAGSSGAAKGQFAPGAHIVHVGGDGSAAQSDRPAANTFVFDN